MIAIAMAAMLAGADPGGGLLHDFVDCLRKASSQASSQKTTPDGLVAFMKGQCASAESSYRASLVNADVQHGMSHKAATSDAESILKSYYDEKLDDYKVAYKPSKADAPKATVTPAPTPAAEPVASTPPQ